MSTNGMERATAGQYLRAAALGGHVADLAGLLHPTGNPDLELHGYAVRVERFSPRNRNVHYQVLGLDRHEWMLTRKFLAEARVLGYFRRHPITGVLRWVQPMAMPDVAGPVAFVIEEPKA